MMTPNEARERAIKIWGEDAIVNITLRGKYWFVATRLTPTNKTNGLHFLDGNGHTNCHPWCAEHESALDAHNDKYFTVVVPFVPREFRTPWHPTEDTGPFATLVRGSFPTIAAAIKWGQEHLNGTPYTVRLGQ